MTPVTRAPMGGTELLLQRLTAALPDLTSQVQIILSRPEQYELEDKPRILWLHDLPLDPASACLRDRSYRTKFNKIVFVSYWQQQQYNTYLGIPFSEGIVIKNGVQKIVTGQAPEDAILAKRGQKIKFVHTSTPHRGLEILAEAAKRLAVIRQDWELDVYSSLKIYARDEQDKQFEPLYDKLRATPGVNYHGTVSNEQVREAVSRAHVMVYPSIYQETSCMALQEALMSGCLCITTSAGALIETCGEWAWMMQFTENPEHLVHMTMAYMMAAIERYDTSDVQVQLIKQADYYRQYYDFATRVPTWKMLLERVIADGPPVEKLILGS